MKEYIDDKGKPHLWFDSHEIERMMEAELGKAALLPTLNRGSVDIEGLIERHLRIPMDQYASDLPAGVLGLTEFFGDGTCRIMISRALSEEVDRDDGCPPGIKGRWRATMAHEAAHVLMHRRLFAGAGQQTTMFDATTKGPAPDRLFRCSREDVFRAERGGAGGGSPEEVQANMGMGRVPVRVEI